MTDCCHHYLSGSPASRPVQPVPRLHIVITDPARAKAVLTYIAASDPRVAVLPDLANDRPRGLWLGPGLLREEEAEIVQRTVFDAIARSARGKQ